MSIIDQAAKRLEQLERAGVVVPWAAAAVSDGGAPKRAEPRSMRSAHLNAIEPTPVPPLPPYRGGAARTASPSAKRQHATLDLETLRRAGWLGSTQARSPLVEEFRQIKRPLLRNARSAETTAGRLSLIMVTSACPGEGKTYTAINLAMSIAMEIDTAVLLVDADVIRADLPARLGFEADKGLLDLLTDPSLAWRDLVLETNVPKLSILPAGTRSGVSTELLASDAMESLLVALAAGGRERIVIFDAPPLLVASEAKVLAARVGQVLLVVEAYATPRRAVAQAFAELEKCPIVMSMLNKATERDQPHGYGEYGV